MIMVRMAIRPMIVMYKVNIYKNGKGNGTKMEYEEIRLLKQSERSTVHLVREKNGEQVFVRKILKGQHPVYQMLQDCPHPCLPGLREVTVSEDSTTVVEEYIEGRTAGSVELSEKQFLCIVRELCSVLEFLHGKGIIHRDIKPSNILLTGDGHIYLIDFDAARMPREDREQDTVLLGTRGFAPPEQYGFAQTDERADIYSLGVTLDQLLGENIRNPRYKRIIRKCMNLDPDKRYQTAKQVKQAFFPVKRNILWGAAAVLLLILTGCCAALLPALREEENTGNVNGGGSLTALSAPGNPHWDGETGMVVWDNVPESGVGDEIQFHLRLYKRDEDTPPDPGGSDWYYEDLIRVSRSNNEEKPTISWNMVPELEENGFYYFAVSSVGDGIDNTDSPYVISDAFEFTGESAPPLPAPEGLAWAAYEINGERRYFATWSNLDDYADTDSFNVTFYDETGAYVMNNTWPMSQILEYGYGGISIKPAFLKAEPDSAYRFTVQVYSSRPNEYSSSPMPDPAPEEYYSPWLNTGSRLH